MYIKHWLWAEKHAIKYDYKSVYRYIDISIGILKTINSCVFSSFIVTFYYYIFSQTLCKIVFMSGTEVITVRSGNHW